MVKVGISENRTVSRPLNIWNIWNIWNIAASGSPFLIHTINMMHGVSVNQCMPLSEVCCTNEPRALVYCVFSQLFSLYACPKTAPDRSGWPFGSQGAQLAQQLSCVPSFTVYQDASHSRCSSQRPKCLWPPYGTHFTYFMGSWQPTVSSLFQVLLLSDKAVHSRTKVSVLSG